MNILNISEEAFINNIEKYIALNEELETLRYKKESLFNEIINSCNNESIKVGKYNLSKSKKGWRITITHQISF
jgi:hypothetical protein